MIKNISKLFAKNNSGAIAINFAILLTVFILFAGVAIDYSAMVRERTNIQAYADAAVLAAAVSGKETQPDLQDTALASLASQTSTNPALELNFSSPANEAITLTLRSQYQPVLLGIFGYSDFDISAVAESPLKQDLKLNLALALDTTLSMNGSRIDTLKLAATDLIDAIETVSTNPDDVKVSLVPFADYVRIDPSNRNEPWLTVPDDVDRSFQTLDRDLSTNCQTTITNERSNTSCDTEVFKTVNDTLTWVGCMTSREDGYHTSVDYRGRNLPGAIQGANCGGHFNIMTPLSSDLNQARSKINDLKTAGRTYMPVGLMWAWRSLDRSLPFKEALASDRNDTRDVILLMSDGSNTASLNGTVTGVEGILHQGVHGDDTQSGEIADALTMELCRDIKAQKIEIITVAFEITEPDTINLLRSCASSPGDFYNATSGAALKAAFQEIGSGFSQVRLSR